jgi:NADH-quinone oxidoreductase subunit H
MIAAAAAYTGDPVFARGIDLIVWVFVLVKLIIVFALLMVSVLFMIMFERKVVARLGNRWGPNRAGPKGWLQSLADGIKLFFKEALVPARADKFVYRIAPIIALVPAFVAFSIVPVGGTITIGSYTTRLQLADPPWGILVMLMASSISVYGVMLAGWSSGSKYPLMGSVRASAQMISYEAALGLTVVAVVLITGSLSTRRIVISQSPNFWDWNFFRLGVVPFILFMIAITAELTRPPFDLTEADSELVGGFNTEYSSLRFALFYLAEFMNTITMSAIVVTLFLGGPDGPIPRFIPTSDVWMPILWFLIKTFAFLFIYVWLRAALPRLRYDQLMDLGWKRLIPFTLAWLLLVAAFVLSGWWGLGIALAVVAAGFLLTRAFAVGQGREDLDQAVLPPIGRRVLPPQLLRTPPTAGDVGPGPGSEGAS